MPDVVILRVKKFPIYDIFTGEGWKNWTRVMRTKQTVAIVGGKQISKEEVDAAMNKVPK